MDFEALDSALRYALREMGLEKRIKERQCLLLWDEVVGEKLASVSQAEDIKDGVIFVSANDSIWGQELFNFKGLIIRKLNAKIGEEIVKDIKVKVKPQKKRRKTAVKEVREEKELGEETIEMIDRMTSKIEDDKLRQLIRRVMMDYYKVKQAP